MKELIRQEELIRTISAQISQYKLQKAARIRFRVGRLTNITEKMLVDFFRMALAGHDVQKVEIEIEWVPVRLKCNACQKAVDASTEGFLCPSCSSEDLKIVSGEEFYIEEVVY